jgi:hypothetical protein
MPVIPAEAGGAPVLGQPGLHCKFQTLSQKKKKKKKKEEK